jgi:hypothetical protein
MTDSSRRPNLETILFVLAVFLAFVLRLVRLGELPLSDDEARWAMQAFDFAKGLHPVIGPQPAYVLLTSVLFYAFQASNFAARLIPALVGASLVFAPLLFRDRLGNKVALILSFAVALEPGLLALSRQAGSPIIAFAAIVFAWGFWRAGNLRNVGIMAGLALLSGPVLWPGLIGLALAFFLSRSLFPASEETSETEIQPLFDRKKWTTVGAFALGTYLAVGSLFLLATPGGLSAGLAALPEYLSGWVPATAGVSWSYLPLSLVVYEFLAVVLAVIALVRGIMEKDRQVLSLGLWLLIALILAMLYPSRQVADLVWALLPLWVLAAVEFARYLNPIKDGIWETLAMTALTIAILIFALFNFLTIAISPLDMAAVARTFGTVSLTNAQVYWSVVVGSLLLLAASVALVGYGWSMNVAVQGATWGLLAAFVFYTVSASLAAANLRTHISQELWAPGPQTVQAEALTKQMDDLSRWDVGVDKRLDVFVSGIDSPALRWVLRDWNVTYSEAPTLTGTPSFVIAKSELSAPELTSAYRGQEFTWRGYPGWDTSLPADWLRWAMSHSVPRGEEKIVLWTRSDIFIDVRSSQP